MVGFARGAGLTLLASMHRQQIILITVSSCGPALGPIWSWPATFLFGKARATGIAAFNTLGALGGFTGAHMYMFRAVALWLCLCDATGCSSYRL